jgi:hypothetical protein
MAVVFGEEQAGAALAAPQLTVGRGLEAAWAVPLAGSERMGAVHTHTAVDPDDLVLSAMRTDAPRANFTGWTHG